MIERLLQIPRGKQELPAGLVANYGNLPGNCTEFSVAHSHDDPYFSMIAHGDCCESLDRKEERILKPWVLTFHPEGETHARNTSSFGYGVFGIAMSREFIDRAELKLPSQGRDLTANTLALKDFAAHYALTGPAARLHMSSIILDFLSELAPHASELRAPRWLIRARDIMHAHPQVPITEVANEVAISAPHLVREFRRHFHLSPAKFTQSRILESAKIELLTSDDSIGMIASRLGFCDESHFVRSFRTYFGVTPGRFRNRLD